MRFFPALALLLTASLAHAAPLCPALADPNQYYWGPDGQFATTTQFDPGVKAVAPEVMPYLQRLQRLLEARGTKLMFVPTASAGFWLAGKMDADTVKGTTFEALNTVARRDLILKGYQETLKGLQGIGLNTVDIMTPALNSMERLYHLRDAHWAPAYTRLAAGAVAQAVRQQDAKLADELKTKEFKVALSQPRPRYSRGWDVLFEQQCGVKGEVELYQEPTIEQTSEQGLLDEDTTDVVLIGTSYSGPTLHLGFDAYLSEQLGTSVENASLDGAGALGAWVDYYTTRPADAPEPKLILWEMPVFYLAQTTGGTGFSVANIRQVLPLLAAKRTSVLSQTVADTSQGVRVDVGKAKANGPAYALDVEFREFKTRSLTVKLTYERGEETLTLARPVSKVLSHYLLELSGQYGALRTVALESTDKFKGAATVQVVKVD